MRAGALQSFGDLDVVVVAVSLVAGVWLQSPWVALVGAATALPLRRLGLVGGSALAAIVGGAVGGAAWADVAPDRLGPYVGWATLADDPRPARAGLGVVLEVEGERFGTYAFGSARRRLERLQAGDRVAIEARREPLAGNHPRSQQARHVVGEIVIERVWARASGPPLARASNRLRLQVRRGADTVMAQEQAALFTGLVIGDDTRQRREVIDDFQASGLSHLTAVSGQNVALVLAVAGVALRRLRTWWRLGATLALIGWFAVITRVEPSVLRASCMAGLSAIAFALGRDRSAFRLLFVSVMILVAADPLLVWSVGFWLSVGATFGVVAVAPALEPRLAGPRWWRNGLAVTLGAQLGVLGPSWLVFGRVPVLGIPANLLAVPVAGLVMLYGLPAALAASFLPAPMAVVLMAPATIGTRWVAEVAQQAASLEPTGATAVGVWIVQAALLASTIRWRENGPATTAP